MAEIMTFRKIKRAWGNPQFDDFKQGVLLKAILPDIYDKRLTSNAEYKYSQHLIDNLGPDVLNKFLNGNRRPENDMYYASRALTDDLEEWLLSEDKIIYKTGVKKSSKVTAKENMFQNIYEYVKTEIPRMSSEHRLFHTFEFTREVLYDDDMVIALKRLLNCGNETCLSYAIFLMFLVSIFRYKIRKFVSFYNDEMINSVLESETIKKSTRSFLNLDIDSMAYTYFKDEDYMQQYNVYAFKPEYNRLYHTGQLSMKLSDQEKANATFILRDQENISSMYCKNDEKTFMGTPILSCIDEIIYIIFTVGNEVFALMCFKYNKFEPTAMYYRTGLLITSHPKKKIPLVQKIVISSKMLNENHKQYVEGILKMASGKILITEKQMHSFTKEFCDAPWMDSFKRDYVDFMEMHKCYCYSFSEEELLSFTLSDLNEEDKIRALEAIKSKSEHPNIIDCKESEKLHNIFLEEC